MKFLRGLCAASLLVSASAKFEADNFAQEVEERLWQYVRDGGGFVTESVSAAPRGVMRSIRAVKDIPMGEDIMRIPAKLIIHPEEVRKRNPFYKRMRRLNLPIDYADLTLYVIREIRLRAARRAEGAAPVGEDHMWDWLEYHLKAVGDYLQFWDDADLALLGKDAHEEVRKSQRELEICRTKALDYVQKQCPTGGEAACADVAGLGDVTKEEFFAAQLMVWSRGFSDNMIIPVASLLNHAPATYGPAAVDEGQVGKSPVRIWATKDIKEGEEITFTYGNWNNHMLLQEHAFTFPARLEPNFHFSVEPHRLKKDLFPQLDLDDDAFLEKLEFVTPYLYEDSDFDSWSPESELQYVKGIVGLGGMSALDEVVNFYLAKAVKDPLAGPFVEQLAKNRAENKSSRVWWADQKDAETSDASDAEAMGSAHKSHAVRIVMSRVLCLTVYKEAILLWNEEMDAKDAIVSAEQLSEDLSTIAEEVGQEAKEALKASVDVVEKAVKKAVFSKVPEKELGPARRFIAEMRARKMGKMGMMGMMRRMRNEL